MIDLIVFLLLLILVITISTLVYTKTTPYTSDTKIQPYKQTTKINSNRFNIKPLSNDDFIINIVLSIFAPFFLFLFTISLAGRIDKISMTYWIEEYGNPFNLENTWWVWGVFLLSIYLVEKKLFSIRKRSKYFQTITLRVLYYLSSLSTLTATIIFFMIVNVQLYSRLGRSTREGFLLHAFIYCYILPFVFWLVYYAVVKNNSAFKVFLEKKQKKRNIKSKILKREQAIKELKEAKDLLNLGILSEEEYCDLSKKLKKIILSKADSLNE